MFGRRRPLTLIAKGSEIGGGVSAKGLLEVNGTVNGDVECASLFISNSGQVNGKVSADSVIVAGTVDGPVYCSKLHLKSGARIIGDIQYDTLIVDQGGHFAGRSIQKEEPEAKKEPKTEKAKEEKASMRSMTEEARVKPKEPSETESVGPPKLTPAGSTSLA